MRASVVKALLFCFVFTALTPSPSHASQDDPAHCAAVDLLRQAIDMGPKSRSGDLLLALRSMKDSELRPLFRVLTNTKHKPFRIHGVLGLAETSENNRLDLAALIEIEDAEEFSSALIAAMDQGLIDQKDLHTVIKWDGIDPWPRLVAAIHVLRTGQKLDTTDPFRELIQVDPLKATPKQQVCFHYAAMLLAESGDAEGKAALLKLAEWRNAPGRDFVRLLLGLAPDDRLRSVGPLAMAIARDDQHRFEERLMAIHTAMRLKQPGAMDAWQSIFSDLESPSQRVQLAIAALSMSHALPGHLIVLLKHDDTEIIRVIGDVADSLKQGMAPAKALTPLFALDQPFAGQWLLSSIDCFAPEHAGGLYELMVRSYAAGDGRHRQTLGLLAIDAVRAWCENSPEDAARRLRNLLSEEAQDPTQKRLLQHMVYLGVIRSTGAELPALAKTLGPDTDNDVFGNAARHLIRARHGLPLTDDQWRAVAEVIQGYGGVAPNIRIQLAWLYLKYKGQHRQALADVLR